jgi:hypothetical protein
MRFRDFAFLSDPGAGLACCRVPVASTTAELTEAVRALFIASMDRHGYEEFCREIDDRFHRRSVYVVVIDDADRPVLTSRVTHRGAGDILPCELGRLDDGGSYRVAGDARLVSVNTYTSTPAGQGCQNRALPLLMAGLGRCIHQQRADRAFYLQDLSDERLGRTFATAGFVPSEELAEPVHFPTFGRRIGRRLEPTRWRVLEWTADTIAFHARGARVRYAEA